MRATLTRFKANQYGVFGILTINGQSFPTIERHWNNNQPNISCIPASEYVIVHHESPKYGDCLAVVNESNNVYQYKTDAGRWGILIHAANRASELQGCIAPGMSHFIEGVENSATAVGAVMALTTDVDAVHLTIEWGSV